MHTRIHRITKSSRPDHVDAKAALDYYTYTYTHIYTCTHAYAGSPSQAGLIMDAEAALDYYTYAHTHIHMHTHIHRITKSSRPDHGCRGSIRLPASEGRRL